MQKKKLRFIATFTAMATFMFAPGIALGAMPTPTPGTGYLYVYPDQFKPNQTGMQLKYELANNTGKTINVIHLRVPNNNFGMTITGATPTPVGYDGTYHTAVFGNAQAPLGLINGQVFTATLTVDVGCIKINKGLFNEACATDPTATETGSHQLGLALMIENVNGTGSWTPTGSGLFTKTMTPNPKPRPLNSVLDNAYSQGLTQSGVTDPLAIKGLFPPGPVDGLILLPITLATQILDAANGSVVKPTATILGYSATFPSGSIIWSGLGSTVSGLVATAMSFLILLPWLKHLYGRLQRATSLDSKHDDTWGVL